MKDHKNKTEENGTVSSYWEFKILGEIFRKDQKELYVVARSIPYPEKVGEGGVYFDNEIQQIACWGFDELVDFSGPAPHLLEEAEAVFRRWLDQMEAQSE